MKGVGNLNACLGQSVFILHYNFQPRLRTTVPQKPHAELNAVHIGFNQVISVLHLLTECSVDVKGGRVYFYLIMIYCNYDDYENSVFQ